MYLRIHLGAIVADVFKMLFKILDRLVDKFRIIYDRSHTELLHELVPAFPLSVGPVIDAHEGIPSEDEVRVRLLFDVGCKARFLEVFGLVCHIDLCPGKAVLPVSEHTCSAARRRNKRDGENENVCRSLPFHKKRGCRTKYVRNNCKVMDLCAYIPHLTRIFSTFAGLWRVIRPLSFRVI